MQSEALALLNIIHQCQYPAIHLQAQQAVAE